MSRDIQQCVAWTLEAVEAENLAMNLDREGRNTDAARHYSRAASRLRQAAAGCPATHPDRIVLARHADEVRARISYLEELHGVPATLPLEEHIHGAQLTMGLSTEEPVETFDDWDDWLMVDGVDAMPYHSMGKSAEGKQVMAASAAIGGVAGLFLLGPLGGATIGAATAYVSTREDSAGDAVRKVGSVGVVAVERARSFDEEYRISRRVAAAGHSALDQVVALNHRYSLSERASVATSETKQALSGLGERHKVVQRLSRSAHALSVFFAKPPDRW